MPISGMQADLALPGDHPAHDHRGLARARPGPRTRRSRGRRAHPRARRSRRPSALAMSSITSLASGRSGNAPVANSTTTTIATTAAAIIFQCLLTIAASTTSAPSSAAARRRGRRAVREHPEGGGARAGDAGRERALGAQRLQRLPQLGAQRQRRGLQVVLRSGRELREPSRRPARPALGSRAPLGRRPRPPPATGPARRRRRAVDRPRSWGTSTSAKSGRSTGSTARRSRRRARAPGSTWLGTSLPRVAATIAQASPHRAVRRRARWRRAGPPRRRRCRLPGRRRPGCASRS